MGQGEVFIERYATPPPLIPPPAGETGCIPTNSKKNKYMHFADSAICYAPLEGAGGGFYLKFRIQYHLALNFPTPQPPYHPILYPSQKQSKSNKIKFY